MVAVELIGGLGNQMFQYAAAKALALKRNEKLLLDNRLFATYNLHDYALHHFEVKPTFLKEGQIIFEPSAIIEKIKTFVSGERIFTKYEEQGFDYDENLFRLPQRNIYLKGYFQSEKYFLQFENQIRSDFQITSSLQKNTLEMLQMIESVNSVSLHIRRGDYVSNAQTNDFHGTCSLKYYKQAIELIKKQVEKPVFFIFSDDILWAKQNLITNATTYFVDFTNAATNFEDIKMMSSCKNNIIANSSFSWWGAWLNGNKNKLVIAPGKWFNVDDHNTKDIIPESWLKI